MKRFETILPVCAVLLAGLGLGWAAPAAAQELTTGAKQVERDGAELIDAMRMPPDPDVADTALVFTNFSGERQRVLCAGFSKNGRALGRAWVQLPPLGLRYVLASDLANGRDFVGSAQCSTHSAVKGTAVFLGPGLTDLPVQQIPGDGAGRLRFPLVATY